jgi:hypothetical protein
LGRLIRLSKKNKIIKDKEIQFILNDIRIRRNIIFHPINFLTGVIKSEKKILVPLIDEFFSNYPFLKQIPLINKYGNIVISTRNAVDKLTLFEWCTPENNLLYIEKEINEYNDYMKKKLIPLKELDINDLFSNIRLLYKMRKIKNIINDEGYMKYTSRKTLISSYKILNYLQII